jgi:hypothetical protein
MTATEGSIHSGFSQAGLDAIDRMMRDYVDTGKSAGMLTLVSRHGQIVQPSCYGQADIESQTPIREDTIFRIYSMTKPITSVALMTLMEQGHFELDDAAKRWIPALAKLEVYQQGKIQSDITIRQPTASNRTSTRSTGSTPKSGVSASRTRAWSSCCIPCSSFHWWRSPERCGTTASQPISAVTWSS